MSARNDDLDADTGAYALNALSAQERAAFEAHLAENNHTRAESDKLSATAAALGLAVQPVTPPPALKANLMAMIASTPQLSRETPASSLASPAENSATEDTAWPVPALVPAPPSSPASPAELKAATRWFARPATALAAVAAAVALIVVGGVVAGSISRTTVQETSFASEQADQLAAINGASDSQRRVLPVEGGATATFVWSGQLAASAVIVAGLEPLPAGQVYELWYIGSAGARPAGIMSHSDSAPTWRVLDGEMGAGESVGVTIEPAGGSDSPTTAPIVVFDSA